MMDDDGVEAEEAVAIEDIKLKRNAMIADG